MSWILGIYKKNENHNSIGKVNFSEKPIYIYQNKRYTIAVGGFKQNVYFSTELNSKSNWIACGKGICRANNGFRFIDSQKWEKIFSEKSDFTKLNGHFVTVQFDENKIRFHNDILGLRDLFFIENQQEIIFSTRLDWLISYSNKNLEYNMKTLSNLWYLGNQLNYESLINGVKRLGPNGFFSWSSKKNIHKNKLWNPQNQQQFESITRLLNKFCTFPLNTNKKISLALSGGTDSRTILAHLLNTRSSDIEVHTWGEQKDPDVLVSKIISQKFSLPFTHIDSNITYDADKLREESKNHALKGNLVLSALTSQELISHYSKLDTDNKVIIDGGYGLLTRRGSYNKIAMLGRNALLTGNLAELMKYISIDRGNIFFDEVEKELKQYREEIFSNFYYSMPKARNFGIENWIDLMYIRTKTPNLAAVNQNYMDSASENFMPFAQPDFLNYLFSIPIGFKIKSKINRAIFAKYAPDLAKIPMEEYGFIIKFGYSHYRDFALNKILSIYKKSYQNQQKYQILAIMKNYFFDLVESDFIRNSNMIDQHKIRKILHNYYNKNEKSYADSIGWWYTFNIWDEWKNQK